MENKKIPGGNELLDARDILGKKLGITYGAKVADLGCGGMGYFTFQAAELVGETGLVYAVDILKNVLKNIETRAKMMGFENVQTMWSNLEKVGATKINNGVVDFVLVINILFQSKHPERILREGARILAKDGKMMVVDWKEGRFLFGPAPDTKVDLGRVHNLAIAAGLKKVKEIEAGKWHYGVIYERI